MVAYRETLRLDTHGSAQAIDITDRVIAAVASSGVRDGLACIFAPSSTSAILANEFEPGLMTGDVPAALERLFPPGGYAHDARWEDANGHSHVRATFLGPSLTVPVADGSPCLGTWQQVVFLELDTRPRRREVVVQVVGDPGPRTK
jgi:secondary thiamine-phosphate synthase enzyme